MTPIPRVALSTSADLLLRLRWLAILHGRVRPTLVVTGGVATPMTGSRRYWREPTQMQMVSAILKHGPGLFHRHARGSRALDGAQHEFRRLTEMRGPASLKQTVDPAAFERAHYIRTLQSWSAMTDLLAAIEASSFSTWLRESNSIWAYPTVLTLHTLGLAVLVGANVAFDLRLLGFGTSLPLEDLRPLFRAMWIGFWVNAISGVMLLAARRHHQGGRAHVSYQARARRRRGGDHRPDAACRLPRGSTNIVTTAAKALATGSLAVWLITIAAGRLMAYPGLFFGW